MSRESDPLFPLLSRPLPPMHGVQRSDIERAEAIRPHVVRMVLDEANELGRASDDAYNGYLRFIYLLRAELNATWWHQWETVDDTMPVINALITKWDWRLGTIPPDEAYLMQAEPAAFRKFHDSPKMRDALWGQEQRVPLGYQAHRIE